MCPLMPYKIKILRERLITLATLKWGSPVCVFIWLLRSQWLHLYGDLWSPPSHTRPPPKCEFSDVI